VRNGRAEPTEAVDATVGYARRVGLFSGTMLVVGGIIGSGIFLNPSVVAQRTRSVALTMAAWALGAAVALVGAFVFAELGRRRPHAGGGYAYLRDAFGPLPAFLYGWALLLVVATGATAAVAVTFASYVAALVGRADDATFTTVLAVGAIVVLSLVNALGVRSGALTQNVFTLLKLAAIAGLVVVGLALPASHAAVATYAAAPPRGGLAVAVALGTALVPVLFAYGGWQQTNFVAEEIVAPERNLPRALVLGVLVVVVAYLLVNAAYLRALGVGGLARSAAPAAETMEVYLGASGRVLITLGIAASTFGFLNLVILVSPRVYQAMARDGLFFASFARLHPRFRTPVAAIACQGVWAVALLFSGTYGQLLDYVVFSDWIFFGTIAATLPILRRRDGAGEAQAAGAARLPLYPWSLLFFLAAAVYVVAGSVASNPANALRGSLLLAAGVPVYLYWRRRAGAGNVSRSGSRRGAGRASS
jgi:APA family basic amino acid/polyamine antiporter